nr:MAG TPA: hypothetical protein [Caudoviricetes sp.]
MAVFLRLKNGETLFSLKTATYKFIANIKYYCIYKN